VEPIIPISRHATHDRAQLSAAGFSVISRRRPGIMRRPTGRACGRAPGDRPQHRLPHEQSSNQYQDSEINFRYSSREDDVCVRFRSAYVVLPGGYGTLRTELLLEAAMTPVQKTGIRAGKASRHHLVGSAVLERACLDWLRHHGRRGGMSRRGRLSRVHARDRRPRRGRRRRFFSFLMQKPRASQPRRRAMSQARDAAEYL
jgi:hypothetical protein